jgi:hypothetical protein
VTSRPWVERQAGISNISSELTLGITSLCLLRGFFFALTRAAPPYRFFILATPGLPPSSPSELATGLVVTAFSSPRRGLFQVGSAHGRYVEKSYPFVWVRVYSRGFPGPFLSAVLRGRRVWHCFGMGTLSGCPWGAMVPWPRARNHSHLLAVGWERISTFPALVHLGGDGSRPDPHRSHLGPRFGWRQAVSRDHSP